MGQLSRLVSGLVMVTTLGVAAEEPATQEEAETIPDPQAFVTRHTGSFNGVVVTYDARAGILLGSRGVGRNPGPGIVRECC